MLKRVKQYLMENVDASYHFDLVSKSNNNNLCIKKQPVFYLALTFKHKASKHKTQQHYRNTAEFLLADPLKQNAQPMMPRIVYQQALTLPSTTADLLGKKGRHLRQKPVSYDLFEAGALAKKLASDFTCDYQLSTHTDFVVFVTSSDARLALVAKEVMHQLALLAAEQETGMKLGNKQTANVILSLSLYPQAENSDSAVLKGFVTQKTGQPIPSLVVSALINKPVFATPVSNRVSVNEPTLAKKEHIIEHFFAVAPANYQDCKRTNPWQFGEQILPSKVELPHYGCFALKMKLKQRANTLLLTQTAQGQVVLLSPGQCADANTGTALNGSFPLNYAKQQSVLELDQTSGNERIVYLASQFDWRDKLARLLSALPSLCDVQAQNSQIKLDEIIHIANAQGLDIKEISIRH